MNEPTEQTAERVLTPPAPATAAWFIALLGWTILLSFYDLDGGAGFEPTDCWVAQTAREMAESEDWRGYVVPSFAGETRLHKSPGPYWAVVLTSYLRGEPVDEVAVRIPNGIFMVVLVATIFWLARHIAGDRAAIFAGFATSASVMGLYWSHRGASDLGVATLSALSLAALWIASEKTPPGRKRAALWLLGYFAAGLAMLYKMPMPLVCVGLPAFLYLLLCRRWSLFASGWHLLGLGLFLLPWVPWVIAVILAEPVALDKWRVEFLDRFTGQLPNVEGQQSDWRLYLLYVGTAFAFSAPFCLSIPQAIARAFRRHAGVDRRGTWFLLIWFLSLLAFFTASAGKETRYFLPAMPPLMILLGMELSLFFDPKRTSRAGIDNLGRWAVWILVPLGLLAGGWYLRRALLAKAELGLPPWGSLWPALLVGGALFALGAMLSAWLYHRRREHAAFGALVAGMWLTWLWVWPTVMPALVSQAAFKDFARQLTELSPEQQACLRQVAQQDPRIIWYSDVRFPRIKDPLELLEMQGGRRDLAREIRIVGEAMVDRLSSDQLVLFVASPGDYIKFHAIAPVELQKAKRDMPPTYLWNVARKGRLDQRYVLFGNRPPPTHAPRAEWLEERVAKARTAYLNRLAEHDGDAPDSTAGPQSADDA